MKKCFWKLCDIANCEYSVFTIELVANEFVKNPESNCEYSVFTIELVANEFVKNPESIRKWRTYGD